GPTQAGELRVPRGDLVSPATVEPDRPTVAHGDRPDPVPLQLVPPPRAHGQLARGGEHRCERRAGHRSMLKLPGSFMAGSRPWPRGRLALTVLRVGSCP